MRDDALIDISSLVEAAAAVEDLHAALSASAASEEAARLNAVHLTKLLAEYRREEEGRFQHQLRQHSEQMRQRLRLGQLAADASASEDAAASAAIDVACIQAELSRAEQRADELLGDLREERAHSQTIIQALQAAREREAKEHTERLHLHMGQLDELRETMASDRRVDPRQYLVLLEPVRERLVEAIRYEIERTQTLGTHAHVIKLLRSSACCCNTPLSAAAPATAPLLLLLRDCALRCVCRYVLGGRRG